MIVRDFLQVVQDAINLDTDDRAKLAELLLDSFVEIDPEIERLWIQECNRRMAAYRNGTMGTVSADEVFREFES